MLSKLGKSTKFANEFYKATLITSDQKICLGSNNGEYFEYFKGKLKLKIDAGENTSPINKLLEYNNSVLICRQNGVIQQVNASNKTIKYTPKSGNLFSDFAFFNGYLAVGCDEGLKLLKITKDKIKLIKNINIKNDAVESLCVSGKELFIGTSSKGLFKYSLDEGLINIPLDKDFDQITVKAIAKDKLSSLWISIYGKGVIELKRNTATGEYYQRTFFNTAKGLPSEYVANIFIDKESNLWFGTYGDGLVKLNSNFLVNYNVTSFGLGSYVYSITGETLQYCGMEGGIVVMDKINDHVFAWKHNSNLPKDQITALTMDKEKKYLFIGTKANGLFKFDFKTDKLSKIELSKDNLSKSIKHINVVGNNLYISTLNGLYEYRILESDFNIYTAADGLPHNTINSTYLKSDGKLLIATASSGIFYLEHGKIKQAHTSVNFGMLDIISFVEDRRGGVWMATNGQGLLHLSNSKLTKVGKEEGLISNFVYQLSYDKKNTIWCGHYGGLSRVNMNENVVQLYNGKNGVNKDFLVNAACADINNNLLFGTNEGVLMFSYFHDKFGLQVLTPIFVSAFCDDKRMNSTGNIYTKFSKNNIKVYFNTISLSNPNSIYYQFRLSNSSYDRWSKPSKENFADLIQIPDGSHNLMVRARIGNGDWSPAFLVSEIYVKKPIWKEWWFFILFVLAIFGLISIVINYRTQSLKRQKDELEVKLAIRTREIEQQKNQIKLQYQETQDSINYGVRIQKSLLPEIETLRDVVPDSFTFFQPKDKVSGDFYYYEKFGDKLVITVADATGHGVPGAFISLIGFVTIKEMVNRKEILNPADLLTNLDFEINKSLHQFNCPGEGKDGMDMAICEINMVTLELKMASALRPIWIFSGGVFEKIRSSKSTVGGGMNGVDAPRKEFDLEHRQLQKGDTVYMFTDGYVDQFGEESNRKLMTKRFQDLIFENNHLPMVEQGVIISNFLNKWKGELDQTDDILVIGIRV